MENPLVAVTVTTYNSSPYILETLDSIKQQTYSPLELVISDDCSTDNTIDIVNKWIADNANVGRFKRVEFVTVPKNTGVSANCNRCINAAKSDWVKLISGDDILLPHCIEENMKFIDNNPGAKIIFSQVKLYNNLFSGANYIKTTPEVYPDNLMGPGFSTNDQFQKLLVSDRIHYTPSYFFNKQAILKVGGYDESCFFVEDYPMWLMLTKSGERLHYFHTPTVGYRVHSNALNNVGDNVLFKPSLIKGFSVRRKYAHPYLPWEIVFSEWFVLGVARLFILLNINRGTSFFKSLFKTLTVFFNPFHYIYAIKKRLPVNKGKFYYQ